jgi:hypothetical protein
VPDKIRCRCSHYVGRSSQRYALRGRSLKEVRLRLASNTSMHNACSRRGHAVAACNYLLSSDGNFLPWAFRHESCRRRISRQLLAMLLPRIREKEREGRREVRLLLLDSKRIQATTYRLVSTCIVIFEMWGSRELFLTSHLSCRRPSCQVLVSVWLLLPCKRL